MEGPLRFRCPPEFAEVAPGVPLGGPGSELWLIRAPKDFCPQSLEGCPVPLNGLERLQPPPSGDNDGDNDNDSATPLWVLRAGPASPDCPLLLSPVPPGGSLGCAPPLRGSLTITQSFGAPSGSPPGGRRRRRKAKVTAEVALGDTVTSEGTEPGEGPGPPQDVPVATEEPEVAKRKKKKKKHKREEQE